jgi:hypothetical protein
LPSSISQAPTYARIVPSGYKDRNIARQGLDASDRDDAGFQEETRVGGSLNAVLGTPGKKSFAFIGPERMGGITVCDVTHPTAPHFVTYTYPPERTRGATWDQRGSSSCPRAVRVIDTSDHGNEERHHDPEDGEDFHRGPPSAPSPTRWLLVARSLIVTRRRAT